MNNIFLRQRLEHPVNGYWDGGAKQIFDWHIEGHNTDRKGRYAKIGSFSANFWFHVATGRTDKLTLRNAKFKLRSITKVPSIFEYVEAPNAG